MQRKLSLWIEGRGGYSGSSSVDAGSGRPGPLPALLRALVLLSAILGAAVPFGAGTSGGLRAGVEPVRFYRGDANLDGRVTLADAFAILRHLWLGSSIGCDDAADVDDDGEINQSDPIFLLQSIFLREDSVPPPFSRAGVDPTPDALGCRKAIAGLAPAALGAPEDDVLAPICDDEGGGPDLDFIYFRGKVLAAPGERVRVPVFINTPGGIEGFTLSFYASPEHIEINDIHFLGTVLSEMDGPAQWIHPFTGLTDSGYFAISVLFNLSPPFRTLPRRPAGDTLAYLEFSVRPDTPVGARAEIRFRDTPAGKNDSPPIRNEVSRSGNAQARHLCGLIVEVVEGHDDFLRGDANRDRRLNLTDMITILRRLFFAAGAGPLPCPDAADYNDDGTVTVSDAVMVARYLFSLGQPPAPPFPDAGQDATGDDLGCAIRSR